MGNWPLTPNYGAEVNLLWTNENSLNEFNNQTVSIDLSHFDAVLITFMTSQSTQRVANPVFCTTGSNARAISYTTQIFTRDFSVSTSGVDFTAFSNKYACVPYQIFGVNF